MPLPTFRTLASRRNNAEKDEVQETSGNGTFVDRTSNIDSERTLTPATAYNPGVDIKAATKTRRNAIFVSIFFYVISVIFLILTIIGNINNKPVIRDTYFFNLDLTNIIPAQAGSSIVLTNSLARSLGLHDFYRVGLWDFCEGYNDEGITYCSPTQTLYWFNPVKILLNELLAGAQIALPADVNNILNLIKIASHLMFGFFLTGVCMNFVNIFLSYFVIYTRWASFPYAIWTFISALLTTAATIIATVMFIIFRNVITSQQGLNIGASIGTQMFAFMWVGSAFSILAWLIHLGLSCCCASRRDVRTGRRKGAASAYGEVAASGAAEKEGGRRRIKMPTFGRKKNAESV